MNQKALLLLGLVASGSACWQTRPVQVAVQTTLVHSCPQRAMVTVGGASLTVKPEVTLTLTLPATSTTKQLTIDAADVMLQPDGTLQFALPRELPAATYQVALKFTADGQESSISPGIFEYSLDTPNLTPLVAALQVAGPKDPIDVAVWHPTYSHGLDLAVLSKTGSPLSETGTLLSTYSSGETRYSQLPSYAPAPTVMTNVRGGNLIRPELAPIEQPGVRMLLTGSQASNVGNTAAALSLIADGASSAMLRLGPLLNTQNLPITQQLVAAGRFESGDEVQVISAIGLKTGKELPVVYYQSPTNPNTSGSLTPIPTIVDAAQPLALLAADLNRDSYSDLILISERTPGANTRTTVATVIRGNTQKASTDITAITKATAVVAVGDLDEDGLPDLAFGQPGGGLVIYYNRSAKGDLIRYLDSLVDAQTLTTLATVSSVTIVDYDGDTRNDIVYAASDGIHVIVNHGLKSPDTVRSFDDNLVFSAATSWSPVGLLATDFSGDLRPDFVVADATTGNIWFLENSCILP